MLVLELAPNTVVAVLCVHSAPARNGDSQQCVHKVSRLLRLVRSVFCVYYCFPPSPAC